MINFNSINMDKFNANSAEFNGVEKERADIVTQGRLLMMERNGRDTNALRVLEKKPTEYTTMLTEQGYAEMNKDTKERLFLYAADDLFGKVGLEVVGCGRLGKAQ